MVEQERADGGCTIGALSLRFGATGDGVRCLQQALIASGGFTGEASGSFGDATVRAVMAFQTAENLVVDGVDGRESAIALDIGPDEETFVVRTPPQTARATDLWGAALSPVASADDDAPPLPADSGTGRRVVYDRAGQRVWVINDDGAVIVVRNGKAWLPQMIRWYETEIVALGFHAIPLSVKDNSAYQTTEELGTRLRGGCQRQHPLDAAFMWEFATVGTKVVVT